MVSKARRKRPTPRTAEKRAQVPTGRSPATLPATVPGPLPALSDAQRAFALAYISNGFNATRAYETAHPGVTNATARTEGSRYLAKPSVRAFVDDWLQPYQMSADEALTRLAWDARVDFRLAFKDGKLLPFEQWPDELINSVKSVEYDGPGTLAKVRLNDSQAARRTILEVHGKLKNPNAGDAMRDLAEILAEKWKG